MGNVIEIGKLKVSRESRNPLCRHNRLEYDTYNKTIQCRDCQAFIDPFNAFVSLVQHFEQGHARLSQARQELKEAKEKHLSLLAARKVEEAWRSRTMVPACPHCGDAIFPEDGFGGTRLNKKMALERRKFRKK
jgi:hypothetical protein